MAIGRWLGWALIVAAAAAAGLDGVAWLNRGSLRLSAGGELWFRLDPDSLNLAQAVVQRYAAPVVWDPGIQTVLLWPALPTLLLPGLLLVLLCRRR
jgi:hypothetical protein